MADMHIHQLRWFYLFKIFTISIPLFVVSSASIPVNRGCRNLNRDVACDYVSMEKVRGFFHQINADAPFNSVDLILRPYVNPFIPGDVLVNARTTKLSIAYPSGKLNDSLSLKIEADAFRSTKNYTRTFMLHLFDCDLSDLEFLSGFDQLTSLTFKYVMNIPICLKTLPSLPSLSSLSIEDWSDLDKIDNRFPSLKNGLKEVKFLGNDIFPDDVLNDETLIRVLNWLLLSSANTLEKLAIEEMERVKNLPYQQITSFTTLKELRLSGNKISEIKTGALSFSVPVSRLFLHQNEIGQIEPGAFKGNFKDAEIHLNRNNLTRLEESVFGHVLQQMGSGTGFIVASDNPIDCSIKSICHLSWLERHKMELSLKRFQDFGTCSNGTLIRELNFSMCDE